MNSNDKFTPFASSPTVWESVSASNNEEGDLWHQWIWFQQCCGCPRPDRYHFGIESLLHPRAVIALRSLYFSPKQAKHVSFLPSSGGHPTVPPELTKSLKKISGKINTVLSVLGSMSQQQNVTPLYSGFPQPQSNSTLNASTSFPGMPPVHVPEHSSPTSPPALRLSESWTRPPQGSVAASPLFSTTISSVLKGGKPTHSHFPHECVKFCCSSSGPSSSFCGYVFQEHPSTRLPLVTLNHLHRTWLPGSFTCISSWCAGYNRLTQLLPDPALLSFWKLTRFCPISRRVSVNMVVTSSPHTGQWRRAATD